MNPRPLPYHGSVLPLNYLGLRLEPTVGFEPTTCGLQNRCSTTELRWHAAPDSTAKYFTKSLDKNRCSAVELRWPTQKDHSYSIKWTGLEPDDTISISWMLAGIPKWPNGAVCKTVGASLRRFEPCSRHHASASSALCWDWRSIMMEGFE